MIAFLYADLIALPILNIYRKYYGVKMSLLIFGAFYFSMAVAALIVEVAFRWLELVPADHHAIVMESTIRLNYTTVLNIIFICIAIILLIRFFRTGGSGDVADDGKSWRFASKKMSLSFPHSRLCERLVF